MILAIPEHAERRIQLSMDRLSRKKGPIGRAPSTEHIDNGELALVSIRKGLSGS
jgi:hypothetical protein